MKGIDTLTVSMTKSGIYGRNGVSPMKGIDTILRR